MTSNTKEENISNVPPAFNEVNFGTGISLRGGMQNYLLMATTYGLNKSYSKKIVVGLRSLQNGRFEPCVMLIASSMLGITFDVITWAEFQGAMDQMEEYLETGVITRSLPIVTREVSVLFSTSYGSPCIVVDRLSNAPPSSTSESSSSAQVKEGGGGGGEEEIQRLMVRQQKTRWTSTTTMQKCCGYGHDDSAPAAKRCKTYSPNIIMQKTTFDGLKFIIPCVNERLLQLLDVQHVVNETVKLLREEIAVRLPNTILLDAVDVVNVLRENYTSIKDDVKLKLSKDSETYKIFFNVIFYELTSLHLDAIVKSLLK